MKSWQLQDAFGIDNLRLVESPKREAKPGSVIVDLDAASVNYRDLMMVRGEYNPRQPLPLVPLSDGTGTVSAIGEGAAGSFEVGDRVCTLFAQDWERGPLTRAGRNSALGGPLSGVLQQQMLIKPQGLIACPSHLNAAEAATLPCAALTAFNALFTHGELSAGQTVVLLGTGGVSIFALQFAVAHGAQVIITSSSDEKLERARQLGAHEVINYRNEPKWGKRVREMTGGQGADLIVEVGGSGTFNESAKAVRTGGRIALIGVLAAGSGQANLTPILMNQIRVQGVFVGNARSFAAMNDFLEEHQIHPVVDKSVPFVDAPDALRDLAKGQHFGKIVIDSFS